MSFTEPAAAPPLSRKRRQTRERLIDAAYAVFAEAGVGAASIDEIVEKAGFTRGAFYSNFASKTELLAALAVRENQRRIDQVRAGEAALRGIHADRRESGTDDAHAPAGDPGAGITSTVVEEFLSWQLEGPEWLLIEQEIRLLAMRDEAFGRYLLRHLTELNDEVRRVVCESIARRGLEFSIDPAMAIKTLLGVYIEANAQRAMGATPDETQLRDTLVALLTSITRPAVPTDQDVPST